MINKISKQGILSALVAVSYIAAVATFMSYGEAMFGQAGNKIFGSMIFLIVFVFSAAFMFIALFGRSVMMYIDGQKKDAVALLAWSLGSFLCIGMIIGAVIALTK